MATTAVRKLELSKLTPGAVQQEAMGKDVDFASFVLYLSSQVRTNVEEWITAASITRTVDGASTLSVDINDYDRILLRSGLLSNALDVQIDGLWFRLTTVDKVGDTLTLTFEDREIAILRTYHKWRVALRSKMTRAEFVYSMIKEVKEFNIPTVIPELHKVQPIEKYNGDLTGIDSVVNKTGGIPPNYNAPNPQTNHQHGEPAPSSTPLTVKGAIADTTQIQMANIILAVGDDMGVGRKLKVIAIMTAMTETLLRNEPGGPHAHDLTNDQAGDDSAGLFQQRPSWGSYLDRTDPETSSRLFYARAVTVEASEPNVPYWTVCQDVQHSAYPTRYADRRVEAERFVNAQGDVGGDTSGSVTGPNNMTSQNNADIVYYFYRGKLVDKSGTPERKPENTWSCIQRLANEVNWVAFFVSGTFYYMSEDDLFKQTPLRMVNEYDVGNQSVDFNYDHGKGTGSVTIVARVGRWVVPPGSVVIMQNFGPVDGRWLVSEYTRDLIGESRDATITLKKPRPQLPEPLTSNSKGILAGWAPQNDPVTVAPSNDLINQVLSDKAITFQDTSARSDVQFGAIYDPLLSFLLWLTGRGYPITITALKSDHPENTTAGNHSAHYYGRAVDIGALSGQLVGENDITSNVMQLIALYQAQLGFAQLIGPFPLLCVPQGIYDAPTLAQHKNHIHVGWPLP